MYLQWGFQFVSHLSMLRLMGFLSLLGQSKFEGLILFRDLNQERVNTVLLR